MDDLIQRQAVLDALRARFGVDFDNGKWWSSSHVLAALESVPDVTPQYTDAEIQKMQELEQAEIEKAYEIGKDEGSDVLDKIRAEIMSKDGLEEALEIIDRYRAGSEGKG